MSGESSPAQAPCPICGRTPADAFRPFCSKRCADVDLQRWLSGRYAIPAADPDSSERVDDPDGEAT